MIDDFRADCLHWRGRELTGAYAHWCEDWDGLPMDETCPEWPCACAAGLRWERYFAWALGGITGAVIAIAALAVMTVL